MADADGATVFAPLGHSPEVDLVAWVEGRLLRIQVKTTTFTETKENGYLRYLVGVATNGGNQSWSGRVKKLDPTRFEYLFVLAGDGRRWFIPSGAIDAFTSLSLGGPKYSEFKIEPGHPIQDIVYRSAESSLESEGAPGEYRSGQTGCAVNALAYAFAGSNPASPTRPALTPEARPNKYERKLGKRGEAIVNQKRRITIPHRAFIEAGLENGARMRARADGIGRIVLERVDLPDWTERR